MSFHSKIATWGGGGYSVFTGREKVSTKEFNTVPYECQNGGFMINGRIGVSKVLAPSRGQCFKALLTLAETYLAETWIVIFACALFTLFEVARVSLMEGTN